MRKRRHTQILAPLALGLAMLLLPTEGHAQLSLGFQGGYSPDAFHADGAQEGARMIGGQLRLDLAGLPLIINPSMDYYFNEVDDVRAMQFDLNALLQLGSRHASFVPYVGAGVGFTRVNLDGFSSLFGGRLNIEQEHTTRGLNLIGGALLGTGPVRLFVQSRYTLGPHFAFVDPQRQGDAGLAFTGGLLFEVGY